MVGARLDLEDGLWWVTQNGERLSQPYPADAVGDIVDDSLVSGEAFKHPLLRLLLWGEPVTQAEYDYLVATAKWAMEHQPDHPMARPEQPVNLRRAPPIF